MILAFETSCDETSVALVEQGPKVRLEKTANQLDIHEIWGGVVPELAARAHQEYLLPLTSLVLKESGVDMRDLKAIAVATSPGLVGPLLIGSTLAKTLALAAGVKFIAVNHLEGHLHSVCLENRALPPEAIGMLVSGGHTLWLHFKNNVWNILGGTRDDAAGEAFDKGARLLGLPYPGGRHLSLLAAEGDAQRVPFPCSVLGSYQVSFSGLKSELRRRLDKGLLDKEKKEDVAAGYQKAIVDTLMATVKKIMQHKNLPLIVAGGVSCNDYLRECLQNFALERNIELLLPQQHWGTDNAAMIGAAAWFHFERGQFSGFDVDVSSRMNPRKLLETSIL